MKAHHAQPWLISVLCAICFGEAATAADSKAATPITDMTLEELLQVPVQLVYSASKYEQKVTRAPASVSIVSADDIRRYGYRTLSDVMKSMRGVYVSNDRNYSYLGTRGFQRPGDYNSRVLFLIDGHRMNDNVYDGGYIGLEGMMDVDRIERVEFVRGPSSSIYGSSAFFGIINVLTKQDGREDGVEASGEAGSFDTYRARLRYGGKVASDTELQLSASYYTSDGDRSLYYSEFDPRVSGRPGAANNGIATSSDAEEAYTFFGSAKHDDLTLTAFLSYRFKDVPTASFGTIFNADLERTRDDTAYLDLKYERDLNETVQLLARTFYDRHSYDGDYPFNYAAPEDSPTLTMNKDESLGEWVGTEWQLTAHVSKRHTFVGGLEYRENLKQFQLSFDDTDPRYLYVDDNRQSRNAGIYGQGEIALTPELLLNAGVRYDRYFQSFGGTLNPRSALIYNPTERTTFKALYGQAFRAPSAYERYYYLRPASLPQLDPERIRTYELTYQQALGAHYRADLSGYRYAVRKLISQAVLESGEIYFANLDRVHAHGIELEFSGRYDNGIEGRASIAVQRARNAVTNDLLTNSPRRLGKLNVGVPLWTLQAGLELQYSGAVRTLSGAQERSFLLGNLTISSPQKAHRPSISASIYNLFDAPYSYPGSEDHVQDVLRQDGRTYRLKLTHQF